MDAADDTRDAHRQAYAVAEALQQGRLVATLGETRLYFDHYGPTDEANPDGPSPDPEWIEYGYLTWLDQTGTRVRGPIQGLMSLMTLGNGYWDVSLEPAIYDDGH